ncbi:MAG: hypothetical protein II132_05410 [Desulfovibrio sp.]|jgi:acyl carrier protein|nr:hypothetical protein [Desulfovibrio sp.]MBQ1539410.1 hypothetical protein [Desulfovibrio sp.]MBQ1845354.1 hypothetical protein [Desulfovibrio sp.]MBQ2476413.1 hypothetical protein [Desulfovibrio sp.]MBQ2516080.1 hypothetical protein [Desulfovibrio sp.]
MDHNDILASLFAIVDEIMECGQDKLTGRTRVMQDLACESIDLLEIGARVAQAFHIRVDDDAMFLRSLRTKIEASGQGADAKTVIAEAYPWLSLGRVQEMADSLAEGTPLLRLDDVAAYVAHCLGQR